MLDIDQKCIVCTIMLIMTMMTRTTNMLGYVMFNE